MPIIIQRFSSIIRCTQRSKIVRIEIDILDHENRDLTVMEMNKKSSKLCCCCQANNCCNNREDTIQLKCVTQLLGWPSQDEQCCWAQLSGRHHTAPSQCQQPPPSQHCVIINIHWNTHIQPSSSVWKIYSGVSAICRWQSWNKLILNSRNQLPEANIASQYAVFCSKHDSMHWLMSCSGLYQTWIFCKHSPRRQCSESWYIAWCSKDSQDLFACQPSIQDRSHCRVACDNVKSQQWKVICWSDWSSVIMSIVYTAEHLTLPGLYSEVIDDTEDDDYNDDDSCYCRSCSSISTPSSESAGYEASYLYHRFFSSLRTAPVFRNFQASFVIKGKIFNIWWYGWLRFVALRATYFEFYNFPR